MKNGKLLMLLFMRIVTHCYAAINYFEMLKILEEDL